MELVVKGTTYIFIEESSLLENGFFNRLKDILVEALKDKKNQIKILMDTNVKSSIDNLIRNNKHKDAHLLEGAIDIFQVYDIYQEIETNSSDYQKVAQLMEQQAKLEADLESAMDRWMELQEIFEEIQRQN
jgi:hypothetical protein